MHDSVKLADGTVMPSTLADTKDLMVSPDYKERFIAEYAQLEIRLSKLKAMMNKWAEGKLDFIPTCPPSCYDLQIRAMSDYLAILEMRGQLEGIF